MITLQNQFYSYRWLWDCLYKKDGKSCRYWAQKGQELLRPRIKLLKLQFLQ